MEQTVYSGFQALLSNASALEVNKKEELTKELEELLHKYETQINSFTVVYPPFFRDSEKMVKYFLLMTNIEFENKVNKHKEALEEVSLFPDNRHKKMAATKTFNTVQKFMDEKYDFMDPHHRQWIYQQSLVSLPITKAQKESIEKSLGNK